MFKSTCHSSHSLQTLERPLLISAVKRLDQNSAVSNGQLVITETRAILAEDEIILRILSLIEIDAITLSTASPQIVIHVKGQVDERILDASNKRDIVRVLVSLIERSTRHKVPVYIVEEKNLEIYATTDEDLEDGYVIRPSVCFLHSVESSDLSFSKLCKRTDPIAQFREPKAASNKSAMADRLSDYRLLKTLGKGAHGKVILAQRVGDPSQMSAIKAFRKEELISKNLVGNVQTEHEILSSVSHPFLVKMQSAFQSKSHVYLAMDFMVGGELFQHLRQRRVLSEEQAKFVVASLVLAIGHLHDSGYVYRDLKPENILLSKEGYPIVADFGLSVKTEANEPIKEFCGTPEYLSPEVIMQKGYNRPADWWSLGILAYEMLFGNPPFYSHDVQEMYKKTVTTPLRFPKQSNVSRLAQDFCAGLLVKSAKTRLGSIVGAVELMHHPWFTGFDWNKLALKKIKSPLKSWISESSWENNFDREFTTEDPRLGLESEENTPADDSADLFSFIGQRNLTARSRKSDLSALLTKALTNDYRPELQECYSVNQESRSEKRPIVSEFRSPFGDSNPALCSA
jgi:serum/glucocorticoid-regulated kinase 2